MKSYPFKVAVVKHCHTPRHLALPLLKHIYLFDLMGIAATVGTPPEIQRLAEDAILAQREGIPLGQRLTLARRGSGRIAGGLLNDLERRVLKASLQNPSITEMQVVASLYRPQSGPYLTEILCEHSRWFSQRLVRLALLRSEHLTLSRFMEILSELSMGDLTDLAEDPRVAGNLREYAAKMARSRRMSQRRKRP
jgi:hypothetical protein